MMAWVRDLRYASRALRATPAFTIAALVTMTAAVAATTAVFSVFNAVLLRPLPVPASDRIVAVGTTTRDEPAVLQTASLEEVADWQRLSKTLATIAAWRDWGMVRSDGGRTEGVFGIAATPELFLVFPFQPVLGRLFVPEDDVPGASHVVLLSSAYWAERFGRDPSVVGRTIVLERGPRAVYTIVGVLPPAFNEIPSFEHALAVVPSSSDPDARTGRTRRNRQVFARLAPQASVDEARREMAVVAGQLASQFPASNAERGVTVIPALEHEAGEMGDTLRAFLAAVLLVLLIAAANVAGLQLARALARQREFSIRRALGGSRGALVRPLVCETALLSMASGAAGLVASTWIVDLVLARGPAVPRAAQVPFDGRVFGFTLLLCAASSLLLALPAVLVATRVDVARALREQSSQIAGARGLWTRTVFVGAQAALALMLVVGAASAAQALARQLSTRPGFDPDGLGWITLSLPMARYQTREQVAAFYTEAVDAARRVPGVVSASAVSATPLSGEGAEPAEFTIDGRPQAGAVRPRANTFNVAAGYFQTLGPGLVRGRDFSPADAPAAPAVAIVNDTFVRRYLPDVDPLSAALRVGAAGDVVHVVGVAPDVLQIVTPHAAPQPEIYFPYSQRARWATFLVVRTAAHPSPTTLAAVSARIASLDREARRGTPMLASERLQRSARGPTFVTLLFGLFASIALLLSATGIAGLVLYTTAQRTREIAVRVTLGATARDVIRVVGLSAFRALVAGAVVGTGGSLLLSRALAALVPGLDPAGPGLALAAAAGLVAVGALACYIPARRAAVTDPAAVMRI
jgi:putative ABC transport system permease protein